MGVRQKDFQSEGKLGCILECCHKMEQNKINLYNLFFFSWMESLLYLSFVLRLSSQYWDSKHERRLCNCWSRAGEMAQLVNCLPCEHEALSSIFITGTVMQTWNLSAGRQRWRTSGTYWTASHAWLGSSQSQCEILTQKSRWRRMEEDASIYL